MLWRGPITLAGWLSLSTVQTLEDQITDLAVHISAATWRLLQALNAAGDVSAETPRR